MRRFVSWVSRPLSAAVMASLLTAILLGPQQPVQLVTERTVIQRVPGTTKTITVVQKVCDTRTVERLLNEVLHAKAATGDAETAQDVTADGGDVSQAASAKSGDVILGQVIKALAICGTVNITANNSVQDAKGQSGDAEVENDADVDEDEGTETPRPKRKRRPAPASTPSPSPSPSPSPLAT